MCVLERSRPAGAVLTQKESCGVVKPTDVLDFVRD